MEADGEAALTLLLDCQGLLGVQEDGAGEQRPSVSHMQQGGGPRGDQDLMGEVLPGP